jgi:transposase InsO family protein
LAEWLEDHKMDHVRGAPFHPQIQGKIERWHQTMKNRVQLENYYLPGDLERQIGAFVDYYNNERYHESGFVAQIGLRSGSPLPLTDLS